MIKKLNSFAMDFIMPIFLICVSTMVVFILAVFCVEISKHGLPVKCQTQGVTK